DLPASRSTDDHFEGRAIRVLPEVGEELSRVVRVDRFAGAPEDRRVDAGRERRAERIMRGHRNRPRRRSDEAMQVAGVADHDVAWPELIGQDALEHSQARRRPHRRTVLESLDVSPLGIFSVDDPLHPDRHRRHPHLDEVAGVIDHLGERSGEDDLFAAVHALYLALQWLGRRPQGRTDEPWAHGAQPAIIAMKTFKRLEFRVTRVGPVQTAPDDRSFLECAMSIGVVAFWGDSDSMINIEGIEVKRPLARHKTRSLDDSFTRASYDGGLAMRSRKARGGAILIGLLAALIGRIAVDPSPVRLHTRDTNRDGRPDVWQYYDNAGVLLRVNVDTNFDGRSDVQESYRDRHLIRPQSAPN